MEEILLQRIIQSLLLAGCLFLSLIGWEVSAETWIDTDWVPGGDWTADSVDAINLPGALLLANDPDRLILAFDASDLSGIWGFAEWRGDLYLTACNAPMSTADGEILKYDYPSDTCILDYEVYEEGSMVLLATEEMLISPGVDNLGAHYWGNLYIKTDAGWQRKETVPRAVHVLDVVIFEDRIWVSVGTGAPEHSGKLFSSGDQGDTWIEECVIYPVLPESPFRRFYGLRVWQGHLFAQNDTWLPEGNAIFEFAGGEPLIHHLPPTEYCFGNFVDYDDKLLLMTHDQLHIFDGSSWLSRPSPVHSENFATRTLGVYDGRLYAGGRDEIKFSTDLVNWQQVTLVPGGFVEVDCLTTYLGRLYAGTWGDGEVYVTASRESGLLVSAPHYFPGGLVWGNLAWDEILQPQTEIGFQVRSAPSETDLAGAPFVGWDGTVQTWYQQSDLPLPSVHQGDSWFQYRVNFTSDDPRYCPVLTEVRLTVETDPTAAEGISLTAPLKIWPNPFRDRINFSASNLPAGCHLKVYDPNGRVVADLDNLTESAAGWDGSGFDGKPLPAGVYLIRLSSAGGETLSENRVVRLR